MDFIGKGIIRKEALEKVTGKAKYTADEFTLGTLHVEKIISPHAHAYIKNIDSREAQNFPGVRAIIKGGNLPLTGEEIRDRYPIAENIVRYHGEVVALVVAETKKQARMAANLIKVTYELLPVVNSPSEAFQENAPILHKNLGQYQKIPEAYPKPGTNIANFTKIRKGNHKKGWAASEVQVEATYSFSPSDHAAMETRCSYAQIHANGDVEITSSSQAPFMIKKLISQYFDIPVGKVIIHTPLVGGAYGGKASIQLELLAYIASKVVGGRLVKVENSREEDMITSPVHIGLEARIKLGCTKDGKLQAADILYLWDGGAYADKAADLSRAGAVDCTGPYYIENIYCDSLCMYTNHPYPAPFRGFSHSEVLFAFERTMDILARKINIDPLDLRLKNAIVSGDTTPTQVILNSSTVGNVPACIRRLKELMKWEQGQLIKQENGKIIAKGISCVWKNSTIDTNASSGVIITFNPDGSVNVISGVVEIGTGTKTILAQIVAEKLQIDIENVHVQMSVQTQNTPEHWKTVGSRGVTMAGRAAQSAADDAIRQLKQIASIVLHSSTEDLEVASGRVYVRGEPTNGVNLKDIAYGYTYPNGNAIGGQVIGKGTYMSRGITKLDRETGAGNPGPEWAVGAQGIEVEYDPRTYTYKITKAVSVMDIGTVMNEKTARGQVTGAMSMGIAFAGRETFYFDQGGRVINPQLRTYRPLRFGEQPEYICEFIETPHLDGPYGARGAGEHGLLGMPAALGNCLSLAAGVELNRLPLLPELIWTTKGGTHL